ncbi:MSMEG_1061 family FMN-dependent PPOX-type flavoprotein [Kitasatospora sp. NPDC006697]|uniref:MSMEG_1061 family FMN-dependent PPOX-type flavoprotein n=1 Tax=Kitasatospora sp. NPDC006697 TaxID=3364020 RepID=UPI00369B6197
MVADWVEVTSVAELTGVVGEPAGAAVDKVRAGLHAYDREFLAASPLCVVATAAADGSCDSSPKGDPAGFTLVLDDTTIVLPERPGNRRVDGFRNILANPRVGLLYLIPGRPDTLRINGRARILRDAPFFDRMVVKGHRPELALLVEIEQVFYHCPKALLRAGAWSPERWQPQAAPSRARIAKLLEQRPESVEELEDYYGARYQERMYG